MSRVYVNGKFLAQRGTGVQRSARQWLDAVDAQLAARGGDAPAWTVLHPPGATPPAWRALVSRAVGHPRLPLHAWEQWTLPRAARDGLLLSLAGSAPWWARQQVATLHDAAVFDQPQAYTRPFRLWYRALFRHLARGPAPLLTVSAFSRQRLAANLGVPLQRFDLVPNGADHLDAVDADDRVLGELGLGGAPFLLVVASANPTKNLARLVAAFGRLSAELPALHLVVVGGRNDRVFAGDAPIEGPRIHRTGPIDDARLRSLYRHALATAVPSVYEGFGLPALEAMASGCPVLAARAAALPEVCGEAALYADPLSIDDLAGAMQRLIGDPGLRDTLRAAGRQQAARFRWREAGRQLLNRVERAA